MPPKRPLGRARQSKLNFSPASNASPKPAKQAFVVSSDSDKGSSPSRPAKRQRVEEDMERGMKLEMPVAQNKRGMFDVSDNEIIISSDSSSDSSTDDDGEVRARPSWKEPVDSDSYEEEDVRPKRAKGHTARRAVTSSQDSSEDSSKDSSDQESEGEIIVTRRKISRRGTKLTDGPETQAKSRSNKKGTQAKQRASKSTDSSDPSNEEEVTVVPRKPARSRKMPADVSSEEEGPPAKQKKRRTKRRDLTPEEDSDGEEQSNDEADELKEDLAFLQSSPPTERDRLRSTQPKAKTGREKALEALKKRRAVNNDPPSSAGRKKPIVVDSGSDSDDLEIISEEEDEDLDQDAESDEPGEDDYTVTIHDALYGNEEDEDFINDDDAPIGMPAESLPLQFSSLRNSKPRDLFKYAIEWMVQKKINPAFSSDDEIYGMTFRKLDDEVNGLASSKYHSSIWTPEFTRAIRARPEMDISEIDPQSRALREPHCEACNRKKHPATFEMWFKGKPYDKETLEPLATNTSDSDSDSDSSSSSGISSTGSETGTKPTYDAAGERLVDESKAFTLGSTCKANAQVAHTLYHWRHHLNSWVIDHLIRQGHCDADKLVARDKWSVRKREKYANKIVDEMEKTGEIKRLHRMYKDQVDYALEAQNSFNRGWGRRA